jgi:hypothetical protein
LERREIRTLCRTEHIKSATPVAAICHQRNAEENVMKTQSKRAAVSRVAGVGLVIGGAALGLVVLTGSPDKHATDNAQLGNSVWIDTHGVSTVGVTSVDLFPGDTVAGFPGDTVAGFPGPSIAVTDGNAPGNTVIWFPGGAIVTGSTFVF